MERLFIKKNRLWLSTKSFDFQYEYGIKKLIEYAQKLGVKIILP